MCEKIFAFRIKHYFKLRREQTKARYVAKNGICARKIAIKGLRLLPLLGLGERREKIFHKQGIYVSLRRARYFRIEPNPLV